MEYRSNVGQLVAYDVCAYGYRLPGRRRAAWVGIEGRNVRELFHDLLPPGVYPETDELPRPAPAGGGEADQPGRHGPPGQSPLELGDRYGQSPPGNHDEGTITSRQ